MSKPRNGAALRTALLLSALPMITPAGSADGQHLIAHRGASHAAPENTVAAFELAWREGADGIEGDFRLTSDGRIVCLHDADTQRVAGRRLVVAETPLAELQALDVGSWKSPAYARWRPPTLDELVDALPLAKRFFIELKSGPEIVAPLAELLEASGLAAEPFVIISFDERVIAACRERLPEHRTHWLTGFEEKDGVWTPDAETVAATIRRCGAHGLGCKADPRVFDEAFVAELRDAGVTQWGVWTVDDPDTARYYRDLGAWSITTNRPAWLRERLAEPSE